MPDFTEIAVEMCRSIDGPLTATVGGYEQTGLFSERHWPVCTCPAYLFSKRDEYGHKPACKHIQEAWDQACGWHGAYSPTAQIEPGVCPDCGGPTVAVRVAV